MKNVLTTTFGAAAFAALPMMASAAVVADVTFNQSYGFTDTILAGQSGTTFTFNPTKRLDIATFDLAGIGFSGGADLGKITYTLSDPAATGTFSISTFPNSPFALGLAEATGGSYNVNDTFVLTFAMSSPAAQPVTINVAFDTAAVPVPAAGLMLLTALGGAAALRRRKKATAA